MGVINVKDFFAFKKGVKDGTDEIEQANTGDEAKDVTPETDKTSSKDKV